MPADSAAFDSKKRLGFCWACLKSGAIKGWWMRGGPKWGISLALTGLAPGPKIGFGYAYGYVEFFKEGIALNWGLIRRKRAAIPHNQIKSYRIITEEFKFGNGTKAWPDFYRVEMNYVSEGKVQGIEMAQDNGMKPLIGFVKYLREKIPEKERK